MEDFPSWLRCVSPLCASFEHQRGQSIDCSKLPGPQDISAPDTYTLLQSTDDHLPPDHHLFPAPLPLHIARWSLREYTDHEASLTTDTEITLEKLVAARSAIDYFIHVLPALVEEQRRREEEAHAVRLMDQFYEFAFTIREAQIRLIEANPLPGLGQGLISTTPSTGPKVPTPPPSIQSARHQDEYTYITNIRCIADVDSESRAADWEVRRMYDAQKLLREKQVFAGVSELRKGLDEARKRVLTERRSERGLLGFLWERERKKQVMKCHVLRGEDLEKRVGGTVSGENEGA